jgi:hypothetical protein
MALASNFRRPDRNGSAPIMQALPAEPQSRDDPEFFHVTSRPPDVHLNPLGDVVVCDGVGEVVLLPHLWNFDLLIVGDLVTLRTSGSDLGDGKNGDGRRGMTAVLAFEQALANVEVVSEVSRGADSLAAAS